MTAPEQHGLREALAVKAMRKEVRDCIGETIPLRRRWVSAIMAGPVARLLARVATLESERDAAIRGRLPHMCRDEHPEIRHAVSDDDERCPVCRERDRAIAAEDEIAALRAEAEGAHREAEQEGRDSAHLALRLSFAEAEITRLKEGMEAMRAALKPFAEAWDACDAIGEQGGGYVKDTADAWVSGNASGGSYPLFKFGDLRAARSVLTTIPPKENHDA